MESEYTHGNLVDEHGNGQVRIHAQNQNFKKISFFNTENCYKKMLENREELWFSSPEIEC